MQEYKVVERIAVLSATAVGKTKELNLISYNGDPPVIDLRVWKPDGVRTSKGVTINHEELEAIIRIMAERKDTLISIINEETEILFSETNAKKKKPGIYILQGGKLVQVGTFSDEANARLFRKAFEGVYNSEGVVKIIYS